MVKTKRPHLVICRECKQKFDAKKEEENISWVMPSNKWYYHLNCYNTWIEKRNDSKDINSKLKDDEYQKEIYDYLARTLKVSFDGGMVAGQMQAMLKKKRTYKGILFALIYWYDIKENKWNPEYPGIWIAELKYEESRSYWSERAQQQSDIIEQYLKQIKAMREGPQVIVKKKEKQKWKSKMIGEELDE